jgi:uncharacterized protein YabN with tetrapyrrole methylase and pyrophosphatase domain
MEIWQRLVKLEEEGEAFGLKWPNALEILSQIESECGEIRSHLQQNDVSSDAFKQEVGDLMHAVMSLAWFCHLDANKVLHQSCDKFEKRLIMMKQIISEQGLTHMQGKSFEELMQVWAEAKRRLHRIGSS